MTSNPIDNITSSKFILYYSLNGMPFSKEFNFYDSALKELNMIIKCGIKHDYARIEQQLSANIVLINLNF